MRNNLSLGKINTMKNTTKVLMLAGILALASCDKKESKTDTTTRTDSTVVAPVDTVAKDDTTAVDTEAPVTVKVKGKVVAITNGKDGYTAQVKDDNGNIYFATISIPNLDDPKQYKAVKVGDVIDIEGDSWKMNDELHIKVNELK